ncbi:MAG TPA: DNA helicase [Rhodobacteraceae bacterium]|nr:DNA helicase [Paracoccaceae bacterium]
MMDSHAKRVSYDMGCMRSLKKLPDRVSAKFLEMMTRYMSNPSGNGLNLESVQGAGDRGIKSVRIDQGYRAIGFESGKDIMFIHVNEHDKAYRWATGRSVQVDPATNRIRIIEEVPKVLVEVASADLASDTPHLFAQISDTRLLSLGVLETEIPTLRQLQSQADLDQGEASFDPISFDILIALCAGFEDAEIIELIGAGQVDEEGLAAAKQLEFGDAIASDESRQRIFIPENEDELRRFFEGDLDDWRVFLHRDQRRFSYRDYNGPAMVRGGAGTGKTVVAMHRAKHLADQIAKDPNRKGERVLFTTFTTSLAFDIEANLKTLCPEHLSKTSPRIEVINLDRWVSGFLKRKKFARDIAYFGEERARLNEIWHEIFDERGLPSDLTEAFVRAEWEQIIQAKGLMSERAYFKVARTGRGTPLDRRKRTILWQIFAEYRSRMIDEGLAEPDDAYREAVEILGVEAPNLPYSSVVVDEGQDMGEQAFRLIRSIVPEGPGGDKNSIFIVGDAHQRIYARRASMSACGINIRGRSRKLRLNYRTSEEIRTWAVSILEGVSVDDLDDGLDSLNGYTSVFKGPSPELASYAGQEEEIVGLAKWLKGLGVAGIELSDVGILAATNKQLELIGARLSDAGIEVVFLKSNKADNRLSAGVRLTTMHRAKGLEFHAVALPFLSKTAFPPKTILESAIDDVDRKNILQQQKSLLHVAATRAKRALRVSWSGRPTVLFQDPTSVI